MQIIQIQIKKIVALDVEKINIWRSHTQLPQEVYVRLCGNGMTHFLFVDENFPKDLKFEMLERTNKLLMPHKLDTLM